MLFFPSVPHRQVEDDAWEEATLSQAEKQSGDEEASHILGNTQQCCDYAPGEGEGWKPNFGGSQFENDI